MRNVNVCDTTGRKVIDAWAIALDETGFYNLDPTDAVHIKRIFGVYLFDRNQQTHLCELTPSYYLVYLYTSIEFADETDDNVREELDEKYAHEATDDGDYIHCHEAERILGDAKPYTSYHYGDVAEHDQEDDIEDLDERHDAELEHIREYLCCNCPF
jgi:hypothetical protein